MKLVQLSAANHIKLKQSGNLKDVPSAQLLLTSLVTWSNHASAQWFDTVGSDQSPVTRLHISDRSRSWGDTLDGWPSCEKVRLPHCVCHAQTNWTAQFVVFTMVPKAVGQTVAQFHLPLSLCVAKIKRFSSLIFLELSVVLTCAATGFYWGQIKARN